MMFLQKILVLGPSLGDPFYVCLRDDGSIASGAQATCDQGSFAVKLDSASGSNGDHSLHFADSLHHEYNLYINCPHRDPTTTTKTVTLPITAEAVTITPPPVTITPTPVTITPTPVTILPSPVTETETFTE